MLGILSYFCMKPSSLTVCSSEFGCSCAAQHSTSTIFQKRQAPPPLGTAAISVRLHTHYVEYGVFHHVSKHNSKGNGQIAGKTVLKYQKKVDRKGHNMHVKATFTVSLAGRVQWVQRILKPREKVIGGKARVSHRTSWQSGTTMF